jgi:hypothetical protein
MDNLRPKLVSKSGAILDVILTVIFFVWMTGILKKHVPWVEEGETAVLVGAAACSLCLSGVFWMALSLFRVTLADQIIQRTATRSPNER